MDLNLTEDQETIRSVFAAFFSGETGPARAREAEPTGFDAAAWERLLETGAPSDIVTVASVASGRAVALAAGLVPAAAVAVRCKKTPCTLDVREIQRELKRQGVRLD